MDAMNGGGEPATGGNAAAGAGARAKPGNAVAPAAGIAELGAEFERSRTSYGEDALGRLRPAGPHLRRGRHRGAGTAGPRPADRQGRADRPGRGVGKRPVDADEHPGRLDAPDGGLGPGRGGTTWPPCRSATGWTYRRTSVGFVWAADRAELLPYLTARQNVVMPMGSAACRGASARSRAMERLEISAVGALR